nr:hypothetical protein [Tanacetum cinerariifolium]
MSTIYARTMGLQVFILVLLLIGPSSYIGFFTIGPVWVISLWSWQAKSPNFNLDEKEANHEFVRKWAGQLYPLELKKVRVNDIARKLIAAQEINFLFKVNFLTLFTNTIGKADGLKGQICLDDVRRLREDSVIFDIDWCRVILEDYMRKASLKCPGDGKFVALHEKYVNLFKDPISFKDDGNRDNVGDNDDENGDDDGGNVDNDANDCDGNGDEEDVNEGDKDPNGSNPSFGFSKISLEDFGNDSGPAKIDKAVEGNPTKQGTVIEGNEAEKGEIMSTPKNFTQWLEKNVDLVGECDLFDDNSATLEAMNQEITLDKQPTQKRRLFRVNESHVIYSESHVIHSETYSKSMFNGTLASFDAKWESFSKQVNAQFKGNKDGLALGGIDLILLHEINVHAGKMLELAKEFEKTDSVKKMSIIVDAFKKREE